MKTFKNFIFILFLFVFFFIINANSYANTISQNLSDNFFRLHILANSNNPKDQELKLQIRDSIVEYMNFLTKDTNCKKEVIDICNNHLQDFQNIAEQIIFEQGFNYKVNLKIGTFHFPTKKYGNISLPAGDYDALRIEIGDAKGENWWCSLFPPLCFIDISSGRLDSNGEKYLKENLSSEEFTIITGNSKKIKLKFKIVEFLNK